MFVKRIVSAVALIVLISAAVFYRLLFNLTALFFIIAGMYEFFTMIEKKGIRIYKYVGICIGILIPASIMFGFELTKKWELLFIMLTLLILIMMQFRRRRNSGVVVDISTTLFGILYVSWFFSFLIKIRYLQEGVGLVATVLLITKLGDIGAFLIGSRFGKRPLMPRISPKKTIEGAIGGLVFSVAGAFISNFFLNFSFAHLIALGIAFGALGQLGDLSESLMKRDCGVKDSGSIFPGLGGVLDEIDSVLFTAPVFYFYISAIVHR